MTPATTTDHWIEHPEGRLFARQWQPSSPAGSAAPLVLFHDSLGCVALWRDLPDALCQATGRRVIAYDRHGFGRSDARTGKMPLDFIAAEACSSLPAVRAQLNVGAFAALGHSVGGGIAIETAAQCSAACERLITISAQTFVEGHTLEGMRAARQQFRDPALLQRLAKYHGEKARWVLDAWIETWLDPAFAAWSLSDVLARVDCPTLAIHGALDEYGSEQHPELIRRQVRGDVTVRVMAGCGHTPHRDHPDQIVRMVSDFLR